MQVWFLLSTILLMVTQTVALWNASGSQSDNPHYQRLASESTFIILKNHSGRPELSLPPFSNKIRSYSSYSISQNRTKRDYRDPSYNDNYYHPLKKTPEKFDGDIFNSLRSSGVLCNLCVQADKEFILAHGRGELEELKRHLEKLIDSISWLWRTIDWNGDNFPDNIGFKIMRVSSIKVNLMATNFGQTLKPQMNMRLQCGFVQFDQWDPYPGEETEHYQIPQPAMVLLSELSLSDFGDCCLGLGFTMRPFTQKQVGISLVASPNLVGGICDYRTSSPQFQSRNVVLISGRGFDGYPLTSTDMEQVLLHELGHAFGISKHDNEWVGTGQEKSRQCSGYPMNYVEDSRYSLEFLLNVEPPGGRFLMWNNNDQGKQTLKWNNMQFSSCSKFEVAKLLEANRGICFTQETEAFCGNGILESSEDCDCGNELNCRLMTCCGSRRSQRPCQRINSYAPPSSRKGTCRTKHAYPFSIAKHRLEQRAQRRRLQLQDQVLREAEDSSSPQSQGFILRVRPTPAQLFIYTTIIYMISVHTSSLQFIYLEATFI